MNFTYDSVKISKLFPYNNKQLSIPRYQRDYSWEKKEVSEFFDDVLSGLRVSDNKIENSTYFFGTTLLAGEFDKSNTEIEVIDGQQRITTMTIFLSIIAKKFFELGDEKLGNLVWKFIISEDYDGNEYRVLKNDTANHYFEYLIQMKDECEKDPIDEEQDRIKNAYEYFKKMIDERRLRKKLEDIHNTSCYENIPYIDILKAIRTQILDSKIICITTSDKKSSNLIFEILNGKGKKLDSIDLIKNSIFEHLNKVEPTDHAYNTWINIKNNLIQRNERVEFQTFFRHYWISKHKKVTEDQLYNEFIKTIPKDEYQSFIEDMEKASKQYVKLICPIPDDYRKRREFMYIIESLNYFNSYFNIKQVRVILLALFDTRFNRKLISGSEFKKILVYLHQFHFAYNALCTKRANALESKYSKFAQRINSVETKQSAHKIIDELRRELDELFPNYSEFEKSFIKLEYSKGKNDYNMLSKYVLNNIENYYSNEDVSKNNGSVEHILSEDKSKKYSLNIGNLILLEDYLNEKAENKDLCEKINIYSESKYEYVKEFESSYKDIKQFNEELIKERAKKMAEDYYYNILGRKKHDSLTHKSS